ncbi:porin [Vibrio crassostreae]|uniref:carbohydrate porin n=1 Tax=Vibrio crassostreae TaxID=246167 RepID=UPI0010CFE167|nr:carbohydrate porin [Vibrio crassostreae]TCN75668.1 porin [Vibrio crassostreae]TWD66287.1 porin [Vibrio crassostreae]
MNSRLSKVSMAVMVLATSMSPAVYSANFEGPDSVENTISKQKDQQLDWREKLAADGFTFGADYFALGLTSGDGVGGDSVNASSGVARLYGSWHLLGNGTQNSGSLVWKVEHRHAYGDTAPKDYSFGPLGYVGAIDFAYSDQGFRVTDLNWKQKINDGKGTIVVGWQDVTNYADVYALASPWSGFTNLAFSTGSGAMGLPDDGVLALSAGHMLGENFYVVGGIADANGQSDDILDGFDTAFGSDASYFTTLELGWTASQEQIYTDNFHVTFWDFGYDTRHSNSLAAEGGSGVNFSWSQFMTDQVMPFVRGGFSEGDVALYDKSISVGMGYFGLGKPTNNLGVALNWAEVNGDSFAADAKAISGSTEQWTAEIYYNMQFGDHFQVTPDIQYIKDPVFSNESSAWVFGIRARVFI